MNTRVASRGFVALMTVLILAAGILIAIATSGTVSLLARADDTDIDLKTQSAFLAESCANLARLHIAQAADYEPSSGGDCEAVADSCPGERTCMICAVSAAFPKHIITNARFRGAYTMYDVVLDESLAVISRTEVARDDACVIH